MISFLSQLESGAGLTVILWFQSWRSDLVTLLFQPFNRAGEETFFLQGLWISAGAPWLFTRIRLADREDS